MVSVPIALNDLIIIMYKTSVQAKMIVQIKRPIAHKKSSMQATKNVFLRLHYKACETMLKVLKYVVKEAAWFVFFTF